ncbi:hypothetical protein STHAL_32100 [Streptomyces halstedii]|uniref:Uncharacterized protein n=1 Tax=Streptomyces halstedii TaxID=1944 RepID=A0ABS6U1C3_STRHA|nr:hypothetical protein [Streptomyces halstedii]MBV7674091.1 hypothetical protein [Streptomyces halstedii]
MPTYEALPRFTTDLNRLTPEQRRRFRQAVNAFVHDLRAGGRFRAGLRETDEFAKSRSTLPGNRPEIHPFLVESGVGSRGYPGEALSPASPRPLRKTLVIGVRTRR